VGVSVPDETYDLGLLVDLFDVGVVLALGRDYLDVGGEGVELLARGEDLVRLGVLGREAGDMEG